MPCASTFRINFSKEFESVQIKTIRPNDSEIVRSTNTEVIPDGMAFDLVKKWPTRTSIAQATALDMNSCVSAIQGNCFDGSLP